jgi:hypothetical protein
MKSMDTYMHALLPLPLPPLPLAGEGWGEGGPTGRSGAIHPHPRLRRGLSRQRERRIR